MTVHIIIVRRINCGKHNLNDQPQNTIQKQLKQTTFWVGIHYQLIFVDVIIHVLIYTYNIMKRKDFIVCLH